MLQYSGEDELMLDFEVMFDNARYYNEEDSQVYQVQLCVINTCFLPMKVGR